MQVNNPFEDTNIGQSAPQMIPDGRSGVNLADYMYRVEYFTMGGQDTEDDQSAIEALLTRSIDGSGEINIVERKDSISATTGIYTMILIYLERRRPQINTTVGEI
tara:strand:+ start:469 stop:783 length:315 start_codon:yes stop_codon:yes gene_type:complete